MIQQGFNKTKLTTKLTMVNDTSHRKVEYCKLSENPFGIQWQNCAKKMIMKEGKIPDDLKKSLLILV